MGRTDSSTLAVELCSIEGSIRGMTATLTIDESGQIALPEALRQLFGVRPGTRVVAEVTPERIEIIKETSVSSQTMRTPSGRLVLASGCATISAGQAVREERDALAGRAARK
jgi:AbrB family looped-hinge helix DNA binding protein